MNIFERILTEQQKQTSLLKQILAELTLVEWDASEIEDEISPGPPTSIKIAFSKPVKQ